MVTASNEERIARLEAGYEHLATKEDLAQQETRLLSALLGGLSDTNHRIDALNTRFDDLNTRFDASNTRFDAVNTRIDASNTRIDRVFWAVIGIGGALLAVAVAALIRDVFG